MGFEQLVEPDQPAPAEARDVTRTNLFLAATLTSVEVGSCPVKVRNLSPGGAMLEGGALPPAGAQVRLARGALAVDAAVRWSNSVRCGIAFNAVIVVKQWMSPPANREQQRVDSTLSQLRSGTLPGPEAVRAPQPRSISAELALIARLVERLGDALSADMAVLARHGVELQKIDIALQLLEATANAADGRPGSGARLVDLRASAEQALRSGAN